MKILPLVFACCLLLCREAIAQTINGPSSAQVGQTFDYTLNTGTLYSNETWGIIGGTKVSQSRVGTLYTVTVNWTSAGAGKVTFLSNFVPVTYKDVTVTGCNAPSTPSTTLSATSESCGPKTLSYSGSPPSGVTWYWQTTSTGTSVSHPTTYSAGSSGTYYLRAKANCGSVWSTGTKSINVTINSNPSVPSQPSVSENSCGDKTLTRGSPPAGITWYWQGTNSTATSTSNSNSIYVVSSSGTYYIRARNNTTNCWSTTSAGVSVTVSSPGPPYCDSQYLNWNGAESFAANSSGAEIRTEMSRTFIDGLGNTLQAQVKNLSANQVLATEPINGRDGSPAAVTLPAPINSANLGYKYKFVSNGLGQPYNANDFDKPTSTGAPGEVDNPNPVVSGGTGTLGWYYSTSNTMEPLTPVTNYPYSRTYVPEGPNPTESRSAGPGDEHRMGSGHEVKTEKEKFTRSELSHYFDLKHHFVEQSLFENNLLGNPDAASLDGFSSNKNVTITHVVQNGETYVKTVTNQSTSTPGTYPIGGIIPVTPGAQYMLKVKGYRSASNNVYLFACRGTTSTNILWPGALLPLGSANEGWVQSTFTVPAGVTSVRVGLLFSGPVVGTSFYINSIVFSPVVNDDPIGYKVITTDANGKQAVAFMDMEGRQLATATLSGSTYDNWSYTYCNESGQVVATVAPNGVNTGSTDYPDFVTTYKYDHLGRLIETTSPDEGTSKFVYSLDGKIRFSQNQVQRDASPKRFSYTNYDKLGRLIEAGEYTMSGSGYYVFETVSASPPVANSVLNIADNVGYTGITKKSDPNNRCSDYSYIAYDVQATDLPTGDPDHAKQTYTYGQVARTENAVSKTWYSYDDMGQLAWTKQYINDLSAYKTVDYTYDFTGNVTQVAYQKNQADDFYHHYAYDADLRLLQVETSLDGSTKTKRAEYSYYLHGPLKRLKLMNGTTKLQGIDYVYTITGVLKSINHADNSKDPGGDGDDLFGETIAYYDNDYSGAGYNAGTLPFSSHTNQYGGAIKGIGWRSPADNQMNKNAYAFTYDPLYQLTNSDFGTLTGTSSYTFSVASNNEHKETIGGYDKNGNISSLQRRGKDGTLTGDYSYVYHSGTNKVDKINHSSSLLVDYSYNAIGQMTQQIEGGATMNVAYNAYGLVKNIKNGSNQLMQEYFYDDQGNRFMTKLYYNGTLGRTLYYIHDAGGNVLAIYEKVGSTTTLIEVPIYASGRIATYKPQVNTYFYEVNDHLGNVRAVIGAPGTDTYRATMESENATLEEAPTGNFKNIAARRVTFVGANVTTNYTNSLGTPVTGNEVVRVNNAAPAGPSISLAVSPGDKLSAEVWAYYESGSSYNTMIGVSTMVTAIAGAFGGVSGAPGEAGQIYDDINSGVSTYIGSGSETTLPAAYLQYIVFDANRNPTGQKGFFRVTTASNMAKAKVTMPEITIEQPGYIYIFVYNRSDSPNWVFFDELLVTHEHSAVVAGADYYPFGLAMDGRKIIDEPYRWGYQGQYAQENDSTGWNEFQLRMYDARFGRWLSTDPYGEFWSSYLAMGNNPVSATDPTGGCIGCIPLASFADPVFQSIISGGTLLSSVTVSGAASVTHSALTVGTMVNLGGRMQMWTDGNHFTNAEIPLNNNYTYSPRSYSSYQPNYQTPDTSPLTSIPQPSFSMPSAATIQNVAGYAGFIPGLNTVAGIVEAGAAIAAGDYWGAGLAVAGAIPVLGVAVKGAKLGVLAIKRLQAARKVGMQAHENFSTIMQARGWITNKAVKPSRLRPDAVSPDGRFFLELKPNTWSGRLRGAIQSNMYKKKLNIHGRVLYYDPLTGDLLPPFIGL